MLANLAPAECQRGLCGRHHGDQHKPQPEQTDREALDEGLKREQDHQQAMHEHQHQEFWT